MRPPDAGCYKSEKLIMKLKYGMNPNQDFAEIIETADGLGITFINTGVRLFHH
jgi:hypothetical protein